MIVFSMVMLVFKGSTSNYLKIYPKELATPGIPTWDWSSKLEYLVCLATRCSSQDIPDIPALGPQTMRHEGCNPPKIWVLTTQNEGCGFPWSGWYKNQLHMLQKEKHTERCQKEKKTPTAAQLEAIWPSTSWPIWSSSTPWLWTTTAWLWTTTTWIWATTTRLWATTLWLSTPAWSSTPWLSTTPWLWLSTTRLWTTARWTTTWTSTTRRWGWGSGSLGSMEDHP